METLESLDRAIAAAGTVVGAIKDAQLGLPTPCPEWSVRDVLNHLLLGDIIMTAVFRQLPPPDRGLDYLGDHPREAVHQGLADFRALVAEPGLLERKFTASRGGHTRGAESGRYYVEHRVADLTAHLWDLARATAQPTDFDPELNEFVLAHFTGRLEGADRTSMPIADPQPVPEGATAADRLAAYLGRRLDNRP